MSGEVTQLLTDLKNGQKEAAERLIPLVYDELRRLGVFWADSAAPPDVFLTRLHVRYDIAHFPEDLAFQETADRNNFQGRYILRHAWTGVSGTRSGAGSDGDPGTESCQAADAYRRTVSDRRELEAQRLASLTGWELAQIRQKMRLRLGAEPQPGAGKWWERLWRR